MPNMVKKLISFVLSFILVFFTVLPLSAVISRAASFEDINVDEIFLTQQTSVTCTLSSAAMMLRRTAACAGYENWRDITEVNIRSEGWIDGVGLRWSFTSYGMTVGHGYFSGSDNKMEMLDLLEKYPQGVVVYNGGKDGQHHAVFLCDYDEKTDTFYVADPASSKLFGRVTLEKSSVKGETQADKINNFTAYWYVSNPSVEYKNGVYSASQSIENPVVPGITNEYDPTGDLDAFAASQMEYKGYVVASISSAAGGAVRYYPSGNSSVAEYAPMDKLIEVTHTGKNKFGALWYKTADGLFVFSGNVITFEERSAEIKKFSATKAKADATYKVSDSDNEKVPLRLEPSEGNNIVAYAENTSLLYIVETGVNSLGAKWLKTQEGYYIKASQTELFKNGKAENSSFGGKTLALSGFYTAAPLEDNVSVLYDAGYYQVTATALKVRKTAVNGAVLGLLDNGEKVKVISTDGEWGQINYNGSLGWISLAYAKKVDSESIPLEITSVKLSESLLEKGNVISCVVNIKDDIACFYKFSLCNSDGDIIYSDPHENASSKFSYRIDKSGEYYFKVDVTDSLGRTASAYSASFKIYDKLTLDSVKSNADGIVYEFAAIEWFAQTSSVSDSAVYNYSLFLDGKVIKEETSPHSRFSYTPEKSGEYVLGVYLSDGMTQTPVIKSEPVNVYAALKIDAIDVSSTSALLGTEIICKISASGGVGDYTYCFSVFEDDTLLKNGAFTDKNESVHTFTEAGTYKFFCTVMDSGDVIVSSFSADIIIFDILTGDVDFDGLVTASDARLVLRHSASLEKLSEKAVSAGDVNKDGSANAFDARYILRYAAKIELSF